MDLVKVLIIGVIISIITVFLKQVKPEYSVICMIAGSILLILYIVNSLTGVLNFFNDIVAKTGVDTSLFSILLKIIGIGYIIEFSANVCNDSGNASIADKVILAGKILIFTTSLPIITSLFNLVMDLINV